MSAEIWEFLGHPSPIQACPHLVDQPPPPVRVDTRLALFETLQLVNNSHWRVKKLIILFENNIKNIRMKTIFEMMSLHCVPYILYWIQAEWKFYIHTYCQIIWVNFTNMVDIFFFQADVHIWLTIPHHVCICPLLPDPPSPPNMQTSFMDGP